MRTTTKIYLAFTIVIAMATRVFAGGEIKGVVKDSVTGEPMMFVTIVLEFGGNQRGVSTDDKGEYVFKPLDAGTYNVSASFLGYRKVTVSGVKVTEGQITYVDFKLNPDNGLDPIIIKAEEELINRWGPMKVISCLDIKHNALAKSPIEMAALTPGVTKEERSNEFHFRGARSSANQIFVDGEKIIGDFDVVPSAIDQMSVITGGVPAQYGDFTGGVIVITTRNAATEMTRRRIEEENSKGN